MHQKEERSVIRFLSSEGVKPIEIHRQMKVQYGDTCLSLQLVYERTRKFMNGIRSDEKCSRPCTSGCALNQKNFFCKGIHALPKRWNTCLERNGNYTEKWSHCVPFVFNKLRDKKCLIFKVFIWHTYVLRIWSYAILPINVPRLHHDQGS
jgi:hypothetical protein